MKKLFMKKVSAVLLVIALILGDSCGFPTLIGFGGFVTNTGAATTADGLSCSIWNNEVTITDCVTTATNIVIPPQIGGCRLQV